MDDHTISRIQNKNAQLVGRLRSLMNEDSDGDADIDQVKMVLNSSTNVKKPSGNRLKKNINISSDETMKENIDRRKTSDSNKENHRLKRLSSLRETVEEIKNTNYELPSRRREPAVDVNNSDSSHIKVEKNDKKTQKNEKTANDSHIMEDPLSFSLEESKTNAYKESIMLKKVSEQQALIAKLKSEIRSKDLEREDLIEEFQIQQTKMINEYKSREFKMTQTFKNQLQKQTNENNTLITKINSLESEVHTHSQNQERLNGLVRKLTLQLLFSRRDVHRLQDKNESIVGINKYLSHQLDKKEDVKDATEPRPSVSIDNKEEYDNVSPIVVEDPEFEDELDDTNYLVNNYNKVNEIHHDESTTEYLIRGYIPSTSAKSAIQQSPIAVHSLAPPSKLRAYLLGVLFIARLKCRVNNRRKIDKQIRDFCDDDTQNINDFFNR
ncbi:uncharacterized protein RJT20DRAFT_136184 [Scheffersomyces xylosifermentans]|uniref:uncharacterized protein n=1 Tax=Scheffersomyces xylosifermentans TaxID=1304137 RepID=UPI00315DDAD7